MNNTKAWKALRGSANINTMQRGIEQLIKMLTGMINEMIIVEVQPKFGRKTLMIPNQFTMYRQGVKWMGGWSVCAHVFPNPSKSCFIVQFYDEKKNQLYAIEITSEDEEHRFHTRDLKQVYANLDSLIDMLVERFPELGKRLDVFYEAAEVS